MKIAKSTIHRVSLFAHSRSFGQMQNVRKNLRPFSRFQHNFCACGNKHDFFYFFSHVTNMAEQFSVIQGKFTPLTEKKKITLAIRYAPLSNLWHVLLHVLGKTC